jgi:hypothetical protein
MINIFQAVKDYALQTTSIEAGGPGSGKHPDFGKKVPFGEDKKGAFKHVAERKATGENVGVFKREWTNPGHGKQGPTISRSFHVAPK